MAVYEEAESFACSRSRGLGGSDIPAILGLSNWRKPIDVWEAKVRPEAVPELDKECLWFGTALEPIIRERFRMKFNLQVINPADLGLWFPKSTRFRDSTIVVGREPWMLGSADGWIPSLASGLEVKNVGRKDKEEWGEFGSDSIPAMYVAQTHWYIDIYDAKAWQVAPLFSGNTLGNYLVRLDERLRMDIYEAARDFWFSYVVKEIEPPIDESESYGKYLARKFSLNSGAIIKSPSPEIVEWTLKMKEADEEAKAAEDRKREANNHLRALLGDAQKAMTPYGSVGWVRPAEKDVTDWEAVATTLSALYDDARAQNAPPALAVVEQFTKPKQNDAYLRAWWKK